MQGFLHEVAESLYATHKDDICRLNLIFPSRRSRIFFIDALKQIVTQPIWQPHWLSLDELMSTASAIDPAERIRLISELYKIYSDFHNESFDKFYFWGEVLLSDFDMIDKYLIDADMLFRNVSDIKELESDISYMTPEQLQIIAFWSSLNNGEELSTEKSNFLRVWRSLPPIYHKYRARLSELGVGYTGMIQRSAVERIKDGSFEFPSDQHYVAIGFNALSECEKFLFDTLSKRSTIDFFWDYDNYYTKGFEQEAGLFIRDNITRFPALHDTSHDNMSRPKKFNVVGAVSDSLQCKYVSKIISEIIEKEGGIDKETAIVLTDENLLTPLLYALPENVGKINVTMGYPLNQSLAYAFIERLLVLQTHAKRMSDGRITFYHIDVIGILSHPYVDMVNRDLFDEIINDINQLRMISVDREFISRNDLLSQIFTYCNNWSELSGYLTRVIALVVQIPYDGDDSKSRIEYLATLSSNITTLHNSILNCDIPITQTIYLSLLRRFLQTIRIPFEGEPIEGVQVMGILETRNLDFKNVIILSMNDDNFPGNRFTKPSYVPYNLRSAYGLPTPEHHEGVFAYYFYRLIQRAEQVWMLYCSHADDKSTGEPSRYIYQLKYESGFNIDHVNVGVDVNLSETQPIEVAKEGVVAQQLSRFTDPENPVSISPTAFYRYVACPLRFYFYSLARITSENELSEDVDAPMFGTILHAAMQSLYEPLVGERDLQPKLTALLEGNRVELAVEKAINENYLQSKKGRVEEYSGNLLIVKEIVSKYIRKGVLAYDIAHPNFEIVGVEDTVKLRVKVSDRESVQLKGVSDRIDRLDSGSLRVVDYKTGEPHLDFESVEALFEGSGKDRQSNIIQTFLYSMMLTHRDKVRVTPSLFYVRFMNRKEYDPTLIDKSTQSPVVDYSQYSEEFEEFVHKKLSELFDRTIPFRQCADIENTCTYCDYKEICKR